MNILFLLSSLEAAGSETYCLALEKAWKGQHCVFWISDRLHFGQEYTSMPISRKAFPMGVVNALRVAAFIRKNKIDVVHSHSRRAHWTAAQACFLTRTPHVTTIHQPPPVHLFSKLFPCAGDYTIAINEVVQETMVNTFGISRARVPLIRNGIDLSLYSPTVRDIPGMKKILMIGRLSGGRWKTFEFFLETLERAGTSLPPALYQVIGHVPEERKRTLLPRLSVLNARIAPARVELMGFNPQLDIAVRNADAVIAAGRSALESLANARPAILLGEGGVLGLCQPSIWNQALRTNLGDHISPKRFDPIVFESALRQLLTGQIPLTDLTRWGRAQIETFFDVAKVAAQIDRLYVSLKPKR